LGFDYCCGWGGASFRVTFMNEFQNYNDVVSDIG